MFMIFFFAVVDIFSLIFFGTVFDSPIYGNLFISFPAKIIFAVLPEQHLSVRGFTPSL